GGPAIQKAAESGDPKSIPFPRPMLDDPDRLQFSFSGLKTAVRYKLVGPGKSDFSELALDAKQTADIAASFQEAVVDCLVGKSIHALRKTGMNTLSIGGGVAANKRFREKMDAASKKHGFQLYIAPFSLCTDNAVMGAIAVERYSAGLFDPLDVDIQSGLVRVSH
ncbi:MAG TPA: tRNA (adenosine(37)-N6)-threonylcarbamoyltransferase complex transferase subunit TsaD, partial [Planctomycetaceae bacterium]|nr:tRNA (adenosine(37)-N6)-threonylcarbamoyltransferase complex transferase subunit TsaD [Planctomycetaceae bacterium]